MKLSALGERIRELLPNSRVRTHARLVAALGVAPATLRRWEVGEAEPGRADLHLLAEVLRTTPRYLESGDPAHRWAPASDLGRHFEMAERFAGYLIGKLGRPSEEEFDTLLALVRLHPIVDLYVTATDPKLPEAGRRHARRVLLLRLTAHRALSPDQIDLFNSTDSDEALAARAEQRLREHLRTTDLERALAAIQKPGGD